MMLALLALLAAQQPPPAPPARPAPAPRAQPFATIIAEPAAMAIAACDANADASVSRGELHACLARDFAAIAGGKPDIGYIGYSDWAVRYLGDANALPSPYGVDTDNDDRITPAELTAEFDRLFDRYDVDRSGSATRAELLTIRSGAPTAPPGGRGKPPRG